jgi:hypothetical protein
MHDRITRRLVTFRHPFSLGGVDGVPPGTYEVETTEAPIDSLSVLAYRRVSTTMDLPCDFSAMLARQRVDIDPQDLEAAEKRDAAIRQCRPSRQSPSCLPTESLLGRIWRLFRRSSRRPGNPGS